MRLHFSLENAMYLHQLLLDTLGAITAQNALEQGLAKDVAGAANAGNATVGQTVEGFVGAGLGANSAANDSCGIGATKAGKWIPYEFLAFHIRVAQMMQHLHAVHGK